jgi:uncharacterized protein
MRRLDIKAPCATRTAITPELVATVRNEFVHIDWHGAHGSRHWARVRLHGLAIAERTRASARVVELFAFLHDARRRDEWSDPAHGRRSAELVRELGSRVLRISDEEVELLAYACHYHSDGRMEGEVTVQTCWDADRLDLGRVGITPDPERLCTDAARQLLCANPGWFSRHDRSARWQR